MLMASLLPMAFVSPNHLLQTVQIAHSALATQDNMASTFLDSTEGVNVMWCGVTRAVCH